MAGEICPRRHRTAKTILLFRSPFSGWSRRPARCSRGPRREALEALDGPNRQPHTHALGWAGDWDDVNDRSRLTVAEFWKRYDAPKAAGKK